MIYDLDIPYFLWEDLEHIISEINRFYGFEKVNGELIFYCKESLPQGVHFTSTQSHDIFSKLIPGLKSLHNGMYRVIESVHNATSKDKFKWENMQNDYPIIKEFTYLNNKFKHYDSKRGSRIQISTVTYPDSTIEVQFSFFENEEYSKAFLYREFVQFFLAYLIDKDLIQIPDNTK